MMAMFYCTLTYKITHVFYQSNYMQNLPRNCDKEQLQMYKFRLSLDGSLL